MYKNILFKKIKFKIFVVFLILSALIISCTITFSKINPFELIKGRCLVADVESLNYCLQNNPYIKIPIKNAYDTGKSYFRNNREVAYYIDIDIAGQSLLSLIKKETATKVLNSQQKEITGKLEYLTSPVHQNILNQIKKEYIKEYSNNGYNESQTLSTILNVNLNNYNDDYISFLSFIIAEIFLILIFIIILVRLLLIIFNFEKYLINQTDYKIIMKDFNKSIKLSKNVYLSPKYIYINRFWNVTILKNKDIIWIYGLEKTNTYIIKTKKCHIKVKLTTEDIENIIKYTKKILVGYSTENLAKYNSIIKGE